MIREALNAILRELLANDKKNIVSLIFQCRILRQSTFVICFRSTEMAQKLGGSGQSPYGDTSQVLFRALQEQVSAVNAKNETLYPS